MNASGAVVIRRIIELLISPASQLTQSAESIVVGGKSVRSEDPV